MSREILFVALAVTVAVGARRAAAEDLDPPAVAAARQHGRIEFIRVRGSATLRSAVIRREMNVTEGARLNASDLKTSRDRILALGDFELVSIETTPGSSDDLVVIDVVVVERPTAARVGGFSSMESFIAKVQLSQDQLAWTTVLPAWIRPGAAAVPGADQTPRVRRVSPSRHRRR